MLETTPQRQAAEALVVKWIMENRRAAGVIAIVSTLVDRALDNSAARIVALEIAAGVQLAAQAVADSDGPPRHPSPTPKPRPLLGTSSGPSGKSKRAGGYTLRQQRAAATAF